MPGGASLERGWCQGQEWGTLGTPHLRLDLRASMGVEVGRLRPQPWPLLTPDP